MRRSIGRRAGWIGVGAILVLVLSGGIAYATIPDASGVIHACYKVDKNGTINGDGQLRLHHLAHLVDDETRLRQCRALGDATGAMRGDRGAGEPELGIGELCRAGLAGVDMHDRAGGVAGVAGHGGRLS